MEKYGYYQAGKSTDTRNELTVTGQSYSKYTGYGTKMDNNYFNSETYRFSDTAGNTMNYTISYQLRRSREMYYVTNVEVKGCETSNVKDYNKLCGVDAPKNKIESLHADSTIEVEDNESTYLLIGGIVLIATILILLPTL